MATPLRKVHRPPPQAPTASTRRARRASSDTTPAPTAGPPACGVRPGLIGAAASMVIVFLLATGFFMTSNLATDLNLLGVAGFAVIFFTLTLGLSSRAARDPRWAGTRARRAGNARSTFVDDRVAIATGTISGRAAMVQVLVLPVTLAAGMVVLALIFATGQ